MGGASWRLVALDYQTFLQFSISMIMDVEVRPVPSERPGWVKRIDIY